MPELHSTGRGGAGNMGKDDVTYVDGSIVREGPQGESATVTKHEYSTGRGGAGNIDHHGDKHKAQEDARRIDEEVIPEPAMHEKHQENFHTGRGGQGNIHKDKYGGHSKPQSAEHMAAAHGQAPEVTAEQQKEHEHHHSMGDKLKSLFGKH